MSNLAQGVAVGMGNIKDRMVTMSKKLKECKEREKVALEGIEKADERFKHAFGKMSQLQMDIGEKEEKLRKNEEKLKLRRERLHEKETHVENIKEFNNKLDQVSPEVLEEFEEKVKMAKEQYMKTKQKYAVIKEKAQFLEEEAERKEYKAREAERRYEMLRTQYEFTIQEWESTSKRCAKQVSAGEKAEQDYERIQRLLLKSRERQERAAKMLMSLETKIAKTEGTLEDYQRRRKSMESTLRELLSSYKSSKNADEGAHATRAFMSRIKANAVH